MHRRTSLTCSSLLSALSLSLLLAVLCAQADAACSVTATTSKDGLFSDAGTWASGSVPGPNDCLVVQNAVQVDQDIAITQQVDWLLELSARLTWTSGPALSLNAADLQVLVRDSAQLVMGDFSSNVGPVLTTTDDSKMNITTEGSGWVDFAPRTGGSITSLALTVQHNSGNWVTIGSYPGDALVASFSGFSVTGSGPLVWDFSTIAGMSDCQFTADMSNDFTITGVSFKNATRATVNMKSSGAILLGSESFRYATDSAIHLEAADIWGSPTYCFADMVRADAQLVSGASSNAFYDYMFQAASDSNITISGNNFYITDDVFGSASNTGIAIDALSFSLSGNSFGSASDSSTISLSGTSFTIQGQTFESSSDTDISVTGTSISLSSYSFASLSACNVVITGNTYLGGYAFQNSVGTDITVTNANYVGSSSFLSLTGSTVSIGSSAASFTITGGAFEYSSDTDISVTGTSLVLSGSSFAYLSNCSVVITGDTYLTDGAFYYSSGSDITVTNANTLRSSSFGYITGSTVSIGSTSALCTITDGAFSQASGSDITVTAQAISLGNSAFNGVVDSTIDLNVAGHLSALQSSLDSLSNTDLTVDANSATFALSSFRITGGVSQITATNGITVSGSYDRLTGATLTFTGASYTQTSTYTITGGSFFEVNADDISIASAYIQDTSSVQLAGDTADVGSSSLAALGVFQVEATSQVTITDGNYLGTVGVNSGPLILTGTRFTNSADVHLSTNGDLTVRNVMVSNSANFTLNAIGSSAWENFRVLNSATADITLQSGTLSANGPYDTPPAYGIDPLLYFGSSAQAKLRFEQYNLDGYLSSYGSGGLDVTLVDSTWTSPSWTLQGGASSGPVEVSLQAQSAVTSVSVAASNGTLLLQWNVDDSSELDLRGAVLVDAATMQMSVSNAGLVHGEISQAIELQSYEQQCTGIYMAHGDNVASNPWTTANPISLAGQIQIEDWSPSDGFVFNLFVSSGTPTLEPNTVQSASWDPLALSGTTTVTMSVTRNSTAASPDLITCATWCGDGVLQSNAEQCDDGNTNSLDGCSSTCRLEDTFECPVANTSCVCVAGLSGPCADNRCHDILTEVDHCGACNDPCSSGEDCCGGSCYDLQSDFDHCGACNDPCSSGEDCCGGSCFNLTSSEEHCGVCGTVCTAGQECCGGTCVALADFDDDNLNCGQCGRACATDTECCGGECVDLNSASDHCGACNAACMGDACCTGVCVTSLVDNDQHCAACNLNCTATGRECCTDTCVDLVNNDARCGACDGPNCAASGLSCCGSGCVDLQTSELHCGSCDTDCTPGETCCSGTCTTLGTNANCACGLSCTAGQQCCNSQCVALGTDTRCSSCGDDCTASGAVCCGGVCKRPAVDFCGACNQPACAAGQGCCNDACVALNTVQNCGACGVSCSGQQQCFDGVCGLPEAVTGCGFEPSTLRRAFVTFSGDTDMHGKALLQSFPCAEVLSVVGQPASLLTDCTAKFESKARLSLLLAATSALRPDHQLTVTSGTVHSAQFPDISVQPAQCTLSAPSGAGAAPQLTLSGPADANACSSFAVLATVSEESLLYLPGTYRWQVLNNAGTDLTSAATLSVSASSLQATVQAAALPGSSTGGTYRVRLTVTSALGQSASVEHPVALTSDAVLLVYASPPSVQLSTVAEARNIEVLAAATLVQCDSDMANPKGYTYAWTDITGDGNDLLASAVATAARLVLRPVPTDSPIPAGSQRQLQVTVTSTMDSALRGTLLVPVQVPFSPMQFSNVQTQFVVGSGAAFELTSQASLPDFPGLAQNLFDYQWSCKLKSGGSCAGVQLSAGLPAAQDRRRAPGTSAVTMTGMQAEQDYQLQVAVRATPMDGLLIEGTRSYEVQASALTLDQPISVEVTPTPWGYLAEGELPEELVVVDVSSSTVDTDNLLITLVNGQLVIECREQCETSAGGDVILVVVEQPDGTRATIAVTVNQAPPVQLVSTGSCNCPTQPVSSLEEVDIPCTPIEASDGAEVTVVFHIRSPQSGYVTNYLLNQDQYFFALPIGAVEVTRDVFTLDGILIAKDLYVCTIQTSIEEVAPDEVIDFLDRVQEDPFTTLNFVTSYLAWDSDQPKDPSAAEVAQYALDVLNSGQVDFTAPAVLSAISLVDGMRNDPEVSTNANLMSQGLDALEKAFAAVSLPGNGASIVGLDTASNPIQSVLENFPDNSDMMRKVNNVALRMQEAILGQVRCGQQPITTARSRFGLAASLGRPQSLLSQNLTSGSANSSAFFQISAQAAITLGDRLSAVTGTSQCVEVRLVSLDRSESGRTAASDLTFMVDGVEVAVEDLDSSMPIIIRVPAPQSYLDQIGDPADVTAVCQFEVGDGNWDTSGCEYVGFANNYFICHCLHLTSFAALFGVGADGSSGWSTLDWVSLGLVAGAALLCAIVMISYHVYLKRRYARSRASIQSKLSNHSKKSATASSVASDLA